jgi:hypothetical protein
MERKAARNRVLLLMFCSLILRLVVATSIELGNDEVYYWLYPRYLSWSYFDHPAMIAWVIRLFNLGHVPTLTWAMRLPALVFGTLNIYLAFLLGSRLRDPRTGYYTALLYASSIYVSVICGIFILPDTAQSFFWLLSLLIATHIFTAPPGAEARNTNWLLFGLTAGLSILSKYHGVFLWGGVGLYLLLKERKEFANPFLYGGGLLSLACLYPIIHWNSRHEWISFTYHGGRTLHQEGIHWDNVLQEILGEFFYNTIPVVALIFVALFTYRKNPYLKPANFLFLLCMSIPLIAFVWAMSGTRETLPHWTGPSYLSLMVLPAAWLSKRQEDRQKANTPLILWISLGFTGLILVLGLIEIKTGWPDLTGDKPALTKDFHKDDFSLDMYGWNKTMKATDSLCKTLIAAGELKPNYQFLQVNWFNGAHVDFYIAQPLQKNTLVLGPLKDIHQFYWVNQYQDWANVSDYCMVTNSREYQSLDRLPLFFQQAAHRTDTLSVYRNHQLAEAVFVTTFRDVPIDSVHAYVYQSILP